MIFPLRNFAKENINLINFPNFGLQLRKSGAPLVILGQKETPT